MENLYLTPEFLEAFKDYSKAANKFWQVLLIDSFGLRFIYKFRNKD